MAALEAQYMTILKKVLDERYVPSLPPLLGKVKPNDQAAKQLSRAFGAFTLQKLLDITPQAAAASVVDDFDDKGIDAIYYDDVSETLYLLQGKLKATDQFKQEEAHAFCDGVRHLLRQDFSDFNDNVKMRQADIEQALDACSHIKLVISYTGDAVSKSAAGAIQSLLDDEDLDEERLDKTVIYYAAADIKAALLAEQEYQAVHADLLLTKHQKIEQPRTTYYGVARLSDLVALHEQHGKALYERNIRYFLGSSKSDVNKAIKATLSDAPEEFFYLNNGVTAVCGLIEPKATNGGFKKFKVRSLSIINGAQTVASAAEFVRQHQGKDITEAKVMLTLIQAAANDQFGKKVTKARNRQNPVQTSNFASLDENQERLRQEIAHLGFDYQYRPEVTPGTGAKAITITEAIRALALRQNDARYAAWLRSEPARLADPESADFRALFPATLPGAVLVNTVLCDRVIRELVTGYDQRARAGSKEKLIYRHGAFVIAAVIIKRLRNRVEVATVIDASTLPTLISRPLDELRQQASDLGTQRLTHDGPLAYFRNQGNVVAFLAELMEMHFSLSSDPAVVALRNIRVSGETYPRMGLMDYLAGHAPQL